MPRRGKKMTYEERLECVKQLAAGKTIAQVAQKTGWSNWVIRKWHRAYQKQGEAGLAPRMGRPKRGVLSSYSPDLCAEIEKMRRGHPGWGPITLIEELARHPTYGGVDLPSPARVAAFIKAKGLTRRYERHAGFPQASEMPALRAHEVWELDAQGVQEVAGLGKVSLVNIQDVFSRLKVESYPHVNGSKLDWRDYQLVLRCAFVHYGLPQCISLDHDSAFFDNTSHSPYPSRLHLWLVGLGVSVVFITKKPPLQHAQIERGHQTMSAQAITGQSWKSQAALWQALNQRRDFLNTVYPSRSLYYQAPTQACPEAIHSGRDYRPEWEADMLDLKRIYAFLAQGCWFRETNLHGEFWLGMQRYNARRSAAHTTQEIAFDPNSIEFISKTVGTGQIRSFAAKGLTKTDLIGELAAWVDMPTYQLVLPFTLETWRQNQLAQLLRGTTL